MKKSELPGFIVALQDANILISRKWVRLTDTELAGSLVLGVALGLLLLPGCRAAVRASKLLGCPFLVSMRNPLRAPQPSPAHRPHHHLPNTGCTERTTAPPLRATTASCLDGGTPSWTTPTSSGGPHGLRGFVPWRGKGPLPPCLCARNGLLTRGTLVRWEMRKGEESTDWPCPFFQ